jgi:hypothetical protein
LHRDERQTILGISALNTFCFTFLETRLSQRVLLADAGDMPASLKETMLDIIKCRCCNKTCLYELAEDFLVNETESGDPFESSFYRGIVSLWDLLKSQPVRAHVEKHIEHDMSHVVSLSSACIDAVDNSRKTRYLVTLLLVGVTGSFTKPDTIKLLSWLYQRGQDLKSKVETLYKPVFGFPLLLSLYRLPVPQFMRWKCH